MGATATGQHCVVCDCDLVPRCAAPERMFGLGGEHLYGECPKCGMLSQLEPPTDLSPFYPPDRYYSFSKTQPARSILGRARGLLARVRNSAQVTGHPFWARPLAARWPSLEAGGVSSCLRHSRRHGFGVRILDIGCGGGQLLAVFSRFGYQNLEGVDPYLNSPELNAGSVRIRRCEHTQLRNEVFDLVMLNHSLEHMGDQNAAVGGLKRLLSDGGVVRIEIPVADSDAFVKYGPEWVELDPPRHLHLHTRKSLTLLAARSGLEIFDIEEAGGDFEFWGSELYRRGFTYYSEEQGRLRVAEDVFDERERAEFKRWAEDARRTRRSGRIVAYLRAAG